MSEQAYPVGTEVIITYVDPTPDDGQRWKQYVKVGQIVPVGEWVMLGSVIHARWGSVPPMCHPWLFQEVWRDHDTKHVIMLPVRYLRPLEPPEDDDEEAEDFNWELANNQVSRLSEQIERILEIE